MPPPSDIRLSIINGMGLYAGAEVWMLAAAQGLRSRGHQVDIVAPPGSELLKRARQAGLPAAAIPIRFDTAPWTMIKLWRWFRRQDTNAVLCNRLKDLKAAGIPARLAGVSSVYLSRESDVPLRRGRPYYRWYLRSLANGVLVNSLATLETTRSSAPWLPEQNIHLLYKGVDLQRFSAKPFPTGIQTIGFAGQWTERKGLTALMSAWEMLCADESLPPVQLNIVGGGPMASQLQSWRSGLPHPENVKLLGHVEDMPEFYAGIHMLAMPSFSEGFGLVAAEALACGRPVVGGDASSLPEVIRHRQTGLLVPPGNPEALAHALGDLIRDPRRSALMGQAGHRDMASRFDHEHCLDNLETLLRQSPAEKAKGTA